ncbi:hypothetical protein D3C76_542380 [compost metagenome]
MSKFYKFKKLLSREETINLIHHLTGETLDQNELCELLDNGFLSAIVGADKLLVGFTEDEAKKIASGSTGRPSIFSSIGVPWVGRANTGFFGSDFMFYGSRTEAGELFLFAEMTFGLIDRPYSTSDLESLDTLLAENCSFLTQEVYEVSNAANSSSATVLKKAVSERGITCDNVGELLYSTGITNLPFPYRPTYAPTETSQDIPGPVNAERPSSKLLIGALLAILTDKEPKRFNQGSLADEIEERFRKIRGLGATNTKNLFAEANKALKAAKEAGGQ